MLDRNVSNAASKTFNKAKSVYSSGVVPQSRPRRPKKPEWNPYKTDDDAYGRLNQKQLETRKEMFKSKNNILHSPEAKAKAVKEKVRGWGGGGGGSRAGSSCSLSTICFARHRQLSPAEKGKDHQEE